MLVLTRRVGEQIVIDGDVRIIVVAVQGNKVRIGVKAPSTVYVDRQEIHDRRRTWLENGGETVPLMEIAS